MSYHLPYRGLPLELRVMIYSELFRAPDGINIEVTPDGKSYRAQTGLTAAILRTNRETLEECLPCLYSKNMFKVTIVGPRHIFRFMQQLSPTSQQLVRYIRLNKAVLCTELDGHSCRSTHSRYVSFITKSLNLDRIEITHSCFDSDYGFTLHNREASCFPRTFSLLANTVDRRIECSILVAQIPNFPELAAWNCFQVEALDVDWPERLGADVLELIRRGSNFCRRCGTINRLKKLASFIPRNILIARGWDMESLEPEQLAKLKSDMNDFLEKVETTRKQRLTHAKWVVASDGAHLVDRDSEELGRIKVSIVPYAKQDAVEHD